MSRQRRRRPDSGIPRAKLANGPLHRSCDEILFNVWCSVVSVEIARSPVAIIGMIRIKVKRSQPAPATVPAALRRRVNPAGLPPIPHRSSDRVSDRQCFGTDRRSFPGGAHLALTGTKYGCGSTQCGTCRVHVDGQPVNSCVTPLGSVGGKAAVITEGLVCATGGAGDSSKIAAALQEGLDRRAGAAVRLLPVRLVDGGRGGARRASAADRPADRSGHGSGALPMRHLQSDRQGDSSRRGPDPRGGLRCPAAQS